MDIASLLVVAALIQQPAAAAQAAEPAPAQPEAAGAALPAISRACWCMLHARTGESWFGSEEHGVFRYDGSRVTNYTVADGLAGNRVRGIQEDAAGNIYFTTSGGVSKFDGREFSTLTAVDPPDRDNGGGWRLDPGDLWFACGKGVCRFDGTTLWDLKLPASDLEPAFRAAVPNAPYDPYAVFSIYRDTRGHVWIGTSNFGACRYDGESFGWLHEEQLVYAPNGGLFGLRSVIEDEDGAYWICNTRYRFRVQPEAVDGKLVYTREPGIDPGLTNDDTIYFQGAVADAEGDLWLSPYGGGVWRWDGATATNYPVRDSAQDLQVITTFKDREGRPWLATESAGPFRFDGEAFVPFRP